MLVHVLGPLRVDVDGTTVPLGGRRSKIVLATLALTPNWVVPLDRLVDTVWGPAPPASARTQIRICVSQLRRAFAEAGAPTVIETHPNGYRLRVGAGELDASVFNEEVSRARLLAAQGEPEEAIAGLRRALSRWTGPAMAGLACPPVEAWARRLEENRLRAVEERIRLELGLGRHQDLAGELEQLVCAHPFREHLHAQLMFALHRSGRTAEALAVYRRLRTVLVEELGIEPGPELRALERGILLGLTAVELPGGPATTGQRARAGDAVHPSRCPVQA